MCPFSHPSQVAPEQPIAAGRAGAPQQERDDRARDANRPVVLIVDDVADNLLALEGMLRRDDIEIMTASSGRAALEILLDRNVAVAIVDVQMPEMDGFELASLMRGVEKTRCIPIIFVTAGSRDQSRVFKGYEAGAVDYLYKPIDEQVLRGKVDVFVTLEKNRQELSEVNRVREMFMAVLGHDLRNPLSGILMSAEILSGRTDDPDLRERVAAITRNAERMNRLIEQLLDAARFRAGSGITLSPAPADLKELTLQIVGELDPAAQRFRIDATGDTAGTWDVDRLLQILSNLLGNAVRHSPAGSSVTIAIDGRHHDSVSLHVCNEGPPIPDALRDVLFEPFRRAGRPERREEGLGLGLYITRELVNAHGGRVSFESSAAAGTRFIVDLPRHARSGH
jgi:signal transduction histidine kinase